MFHAIASPYRERSHFDGQDVLENGSSQAHAVDTLERITDLYAGDQLLAVRLADALAADAIADPAGTSMQAAAAIDGAPTASARAAAVRTVEMSGALESSVFPNSTAARPIKGLFRA